MAQGPTLIQRYREERQVRHYARSSGAVELPHTLERKSRNAAREWGWQRQFPQARRWRYPHRTIEGRHHLDPSLVQRAVRAAVQAAAISKPATCHTFRDSFATHLLGHSDMKTTMIYPTCSSAPPWASSAQPISCSSRYKWITGPITNVRNEHIWPKASAVAKICLAAWRWFTERSRSGIVVHGNHPIGVRPMDDTIDMSVST